MKTISGYITSSKDVSLSKAAKIMADFVTNDTGAPQAVSVFLNRTSKAFNELVQFHKKLKTGGGSGRKRKGYSYGNDNLKEDTEKTPRKEENEVEKTPRKKKIEKTSRKEENEIKNSENHEEENKKKKKRKKVEVEDESVGNSEERHSRKKKRRKHEEGN